MAQLPEIQDVTVQDETDEQIIDAADMVRYPLVMVPALGSDSRLWQPVVERIRRFVDCKVIRGDGDSIEAMAESILRKAPEQFYLAGISMGGYVSLEIALRRTGRIKGLALLNTSAIEAPPERRESSVRLIEMADSGNFDAAVDRISGAVARPSREDVIASAALMARELGPEVFKAQQQAVLNRSNRRSELPAITVPTLVVAGGADNITPVVLSEDLAALIPGSELIVIDGCGHLSPLEEPGKVASNLLRWLLQNAEQSNEDCESPRTTASGPEVWRQSGVPISRP